MKSPLRTSVVGILINDISKVWSMKSPLRTSVIKILINYISKVRKQRALWSMKLPFRTSVIKILSNEISKVRKQRALWSMNSPILVPSHWWCLKRGCRERRDLWSPPRTRTSGTDTWQPEKRSNRYFTQKLFLHENLKGICYEMDLVFFSFVDRS